VHRLPREVLRKRDRHRTSTKFRFRVISWVHELLKRPSYYIILYYIVFYGFALRYIALCYVMLCYVAFNFIMCYRNVDVNCGGGDDDDDNDKLGMPHTSRNMWFISNFNFLFWIKWFKIFSTLEKGSFLDRCLEKFLSCPRIVCNLWAARMETALQA